MKLKQTHKQKSLKKPTRFLLNELFNFCFKQTNESTFAFCRQQKRHLIEMVATTFALLIELIMK